MTRCRWFLIALLGAVVLHPASASAQAIAGTVTDPSGSVVPGVTVEASSPVLIEGVRTAVTNAAGRYSIIDLRPGIYTVTFSLPGFNTVKREGIELTSDFTAPVSVQLAVGRVEEVVTVVSDAPLVDVQNIGKPQTMTKEMLETLPLGTRTIQDIISRVPGAGFGAFGTINYRGNGDVLTTVDGNRTVWLNGPGPGSSTQALAAAAYEEYSFTQPIDNVQSPTGSISINVVPKDGGNRFSGSNFIIYTQEGWASDNRGDYANPPYNLTAPAALVHQLDFNPTYGGPIVRNKLWFQTTFHYKANDPLLSGVYPDSDPDPWSYVPDQSKRVLGDQRHYAGGGRLTWQASAKDKIAGSFDTEYYHWPNFFIFPGSNPTTGFNNVTPAQMNVTGKWTRTHSSRLLLEGGGSFFTLRLNNETRPGAEAWSASNGSALVTSGLPVPTADIMAINLLSGFFPLGVGNQSPTNSKSVSDSYTGNFSLTYMKGSHTILAGATVLIGRTLAQDRLIGDATLVIRNTGTALVSNSINAGIPNNTRNSIDGDYGFYVQDQWTHRRLTLKGSLRFDWLMTSYPDQLQPGNVWLAEQNCSTNAQFCGADVLNWKDLSPRASAAYDLFGNGRTALKFGFARYIAAQTTAITQAVNPMGSISRGASTVWNDVDGNKTIYDASGNLQRGELVLPFPQTTFGTAVITTRYDPDVLRGWFKRGYTYETNVGVDHQLLPRLSASVMYYHRVGGNQTVTDNLNTTGQPGLDYTGPFCLRAPTDSLIPGGGGTDVCGLFDITPVGQAKLLMPGSNLVTFFHKLGTGAGRQDVRDGFDIALRANLPGGTFLTGGLDIASTLTDTCDFSESPERRFCHNRLNFNVLPRISGSYTVPDFDSLGVAGDILKGMQVSANYTMNRGPQITAAWTASDCRPGTLGCVPGRFNDFDYSASLGLPALGRPLTAVNNPSKGIALIAAGQHFYPYVHNFDMRFAKLVNVSRYKITIGVDLYNTFNSDAILNVNNTYGFTTLLPGETRTYATQVGVGNFLPAPRQVRLTANFAF